MSKQRAIIVVLGLAAIVVSGLYPPWLWQLTGSVPGGGSVMMRISDAPGRDTSYAWLWTPPAGNIYTVSVIDWQRLLLTWAVIAAATTCLFILMPYLRFKYAL
jgi:hypothetical protein